MNSDKIEIRNRMIEKHSALLSEWIAQASAQAQIRVLAMEKLKAAESVCAYLAMSSEVRTNTIIEACLAAGKKMYVPAFRGETGRYEPARCSKGILIETRHGAPEPTHPQWLGDDPLADRIDLVIVPGLAFDRGGMRLGRGRGHYDRMLKTDSLRGAFRLGLTFEFQILDSIPFDAHDEKMDAVITEERIYMSNL